MGPISQSLCLEPALTGPDQPGSMWDLLTDFSVHGPTYEFPEGELEGAATL